MELVLFVIIAIFCLFLMLIGLVGIVFPFIPGIFLTWFGFFLYGWAGNFEKISFNQAIIFLLLVICSIIFDFLAPLVGAKKYKATKYGLIGATMGMTLGIFIFGPIGIVFGSLIGAFLGEILSGKEFLGAIKPAFGTILGFLVGLIFKITIALAMFGFFIASLLK